MSRPYNLADKIGMTFLALLLIQLVAWATYGAVLYANWVWQSWLRLAGLTTVLTTIGTLLLANYSYLIQHRK